MSNTRIARQDVTAIEAVHADVVVNGAPNRLSIVIVAAGQQRVIVRMDSGTLTRLHSRIGSVLSPRRLYSVLPR